jgi:hypothetical protein
MQLNASILMRLSDSHLPASSEIISHPSCGQRDSRGLSHFVTCNRSRIEGVTSKLETRGRNCRRLSILIVILGSAYIDDMKLYGGLSSCAGALRGNHPSPQRHHFPLGGSDSAHTNQSFGRPITLTCLRLPRSLGGVRNRNNPSRLPRVFTTSQIQLWLILPQGQWPSTPHKPPVSDIRVYINRLSEAGEMLQLPTILCLRLTLTLFSVRLGSLPRRR